MNFFFNYENIKKVLIILLKIKIKLILKSNLKRIKTFSRMSNEVINKLSKF